MRLHVHHRDRGQEAGADAGDELHRHASAVDRARHDGAPVGEYGEHVHVAGKGDGPSLTHLHRRLRPSGPAAPAPAASASARPARLTAPARPAAARWWRGTRATCRSMLRAGGGAQEARVHQPDAAVTAEEDRGRERREPAKLRQRGAGRGGITHAGEQEGVGNRVRGAEAPHQRRVHRRVTGDLVREPECILRPRWWGRW